MINRTDLEFLDDMGVKMYLNDLYQDIRDNNLKSELEFNDIYIRVVRNDGKMKYITQFDKISNNIWYKTFDSVRV